MDRETQKAIEHLLAEQKRLRRDVNRLNVIENGPGLGEIYAMHLALPILRGFWPMSSVYESGFVSDLSGQGRSLTYIGNAIFGLHNGVVPYIEFDGTGDYLTRGDEAGLDILGTEAYVAAKGLTAGCWAWANDDSVHRPLSSKWTSSGNQKSWLLRRESSNSLTAYISSDGVSNTASVNSGSSSFLLGSWKFCAVRFTPSAELAVFLNGVKSVNTTSIPAALFNSTAPFQLGAMDAGVTVHNGRVALAWLCASALSDAAINRLYSTTRIAFGV